MTLRPDFLDEIRERVTLSEVVGRQVKLQRRGREHQGLCPFHSEKTPSFTVSDDKGFYHCFGCHAHGSLFDFVMQTESVSFIEAVERLANEAGLQMPTRSPDEQARADQRTELIDVMETAATWFESQLAAAAGQEARAYLANRGVAPETIKKFRIGYGPSARTALKDALLARHVGADDLIATGLVIAPDDGGDTFDRFRHRIMFPITDRRGRTIAFGGRALNPDAKAKYLNSPETPLFHKGRVLYNLAAARQSIFESNTALVVEGYMDVIALAEAGIEYAVAPLGTALTEEQIQLLWRATPEPVVCLDGDAAGLRAAYAAAERALPLLRPGHSLRFAFLPDGDDPDSLVRAQGRATIDSLIASAKPLGDVVWQARVDGRRFDTPEARAALDKDVEDLVAQISDSTVRNYYRAAMRERLWQAFGAGALSSDEARRRSPRANSHRNRVRETSTARFAPTSTFRQERLLLAALVNHPALVPQVFEDLAACEFADSELDALRLAILEIAGAGAHSDGLDSAELREHLLKKGFSAILDKIAGRNVARLDWFADPSSEIEDVEIGWRHALARHHRAITLPRELAEAQAAFASDPSETNEARLLALKREEITGAGDEASHDGFGVASGRAVRF